jgi:chromosome segregation ATPase
MSIDGELFASIPRTAESRGGTLPASMGLPTAWEARADNLVTRHYTAKAGMTAEQAGEQVRVVDHKLRTLTSLLSTSKAQFDVLEGRVRDLVQDFRAPDSELATAHLALIDLQNRNDQLIKQCRSWKQRVEEAKQKAETYETKWRESQQQVKGVQESFDNHRLAKLREMPLLARKGTPGDSVRYLADEVMKHAADSMELAGIAVALRMVAADIDGLSRT